MESNMDDQVPGNNPADKTPSAFHTHFIASTYRPPGTPVTVGPAPEPPRTSPSD